MNERETKELWGWETQSRYVKYHNRQQGRVFVLGYPWPFLLQMCSFLCFCWLKGFILQTHTKSCLSPGLCRPSLQSWRLTFLEFVVTLLIQLIFWLLLDMFYSLSQADWSMNPYHSHHPSSLQVTIPLSGRSPKYSLCLIYFFLPALFFQALLLKWTSSSKPSPVAPRFCQMPLPLLPQHPLCAVFQQATHLVTGLLTILYPPPEGLLGGGRAVSAMFR